jgi:hypothetical protein
LVGFAGNYGGGFVGFGGGGLAVAAAQQQAAGQGRQKEPRKRGWAGRRGKPEHEEMGKVRVLELSEDLYARLGGGVGQKASFP